ncbi:MAG: response regulator transcription factor [Planctomycetes bacterium]|nr:response regulator transcription factor [Planctomycetota bacterium]
MRLLLVEDNDLLRTSLAGGLGQVGFTVSAAADGLEGWRLASEQEFDLVVLDRMLPGLDGLDLLRRLRLAGSRVPVLLLTARDAVEDRVAGLEAGADDYLTKPFAVAELIARLRALLRRGRGGGDPVVALADLEVDTAARLARRGGRRLDLSAKEYALLELLLARRGEAVTRQEVLERLYAQEGESASNVVEVLVGRLRRKLHPPGARPLLHTRRGFGYVLAEEEP